MILVWIIELKELGRHCAEHRRAGQISGFLAMQNLLQRFGEPQPDGSYAFSNVRSGLIVGLVSHFPIASRDAQHCHQSAVYWDLGWSPRRRSHRRPHWPKYSMIVWSIIFSIGVIIQMAANTVWQQVAVGRLIAGAGVGALSIMVPMYTSETGPRQVRGALVSTYQLFITAGIFTADAINYGTEARPNSGSWRIPMGVGFIWPLILGIGILFFPESPRYAYRKGRAGEARRTMAQFYGVHESHGEVKREMAEIKAKYDLEVSLGKRPWIELITGQRMAYRTMLGIVLQALQQLTGANFCWIKDSSHLTASGMDNRIQESIPLVLSLCT